MSQSNLSIGIVTYETHAEIVRNCLCNLREALSFATEQGLLSGTKLQIISNGGDITELKEMSISKSFLDTEPIIIENERNVGFARAHNQIIKTLESDFHLVLNPDVYLQKESLCAALEFLRNNKCAVLAGFRGFTEEGEPAFLSKRYPSLFVFLLRAIESLFRLRFFNSYLDHYEYHDLSQREPSEVELVSGCAMLAKSDALKKVGGFDERFFLYFEDFDLSLRLSEYGKIFFIPNAKLTHLGGKTSTKGLKRIVSFLKSAVIFYRLHRIKLF